MSHAYESRVANLLGAVSVAIGDAVAAATAEVAGHGASAPAALTLLEGPTGGATIERLRRELGLTHSGAVRLVDRLAAARLVERRLGADARSLSLHLTPTGRRTARRVLAARQSALEQALLPLRPAQREQLGALLAAVLEPTRDAGERICRLCDTEACGRPRGACPRQR